MSTRCAWPGCASVHPSDRVTDLVADGWARDDDDELICRACDERLRAELDAEFARLADVERETPECVSCHGTGEGYGSGYCGACGGRGTEVVSL